jgi:glutaredoxin
MNAIHPLSWPSPPAAGSRLRLLALAALVGLCATPVVAQTMYRIVGPDGRVTFSDKPPPPGAAAKPLESAAGGSSAGGNAQLPYELRQVASRYPVVLYSGTDCAPCNSGRNLLNARGIPYTEKTVTTAQDGEALKRLSGDASLPFLTIGGQQIKGYSDAEWTQFLNAAGYPKQSALPSSYRRPAATPLVVVAPVEKPADGKQAGSITPGTAPTPVPVEAPPGIRF